MGEGEEGQGRGADPLMFEHTRSGTVMGLGAGIMLRPGRRLAAPYILFSFFTPPPAKCVAFREEWTSKGGGGKSRGAGEAPRAAKRAKGCFQSQTAVVPREVRPVMGVRSNLVLSDKKCSLVVRSR